MENTQTYALTHENKMCKERRCRSRVTYHTEVEIKTPIGSITGGTVDISLNGAFVKTSQTLPLNTPCILILKLHDDYSATYLPFEGIVVRIDKDGMGIKFTQMDPEAFYHLLNIIYYYLGDDELVDRELKKDAF